VGQSSHPHLFHQDEELADIIRRAGSHTAGVNYGTPGGESWLANIPDEPVSAGVEADSAISGWRDAHKDIVVVMELSIINCATNLQPEVLTALKVGPWNPPTLQMEIRDGKAHNLGWSGFNRFGPLAPPAQADDPSSAPNV
jgi:hypothetical protein